MIDEAFHLTPVDVRRYALETEMRGYRKSQVDDFKARVADELERMARINQELDGKARNFHEQLRAFRDRDKALNEALVSAQQLRAETRDQAEREAVLVIREARAEGERIVEEARAEVRRLATELEALDRARRTFVLQLRGMIDRQRAELDAAESSVAMPSYSSSESQGGSRVSHPTPAWLEPVPQE